MEYEPRPGTLNLGEEYEILTPALFALRGVYQKDIKDLWLATNVNGLGAFDDVVLYLEFENGAKSLYVIQLKHKKESISATRFTKPNDDYNIMKYQDSFDQIISNHGNGILKGFPPENTYFIIYTIADFSNTIDRKKMEKLNLALENIDQAQNPLLNTSSDDEFLYKFKISNENNEIYYKPNFLSRFQLYIKQARTKTIEREIQEILNEFDQRLEQDVKIIFIDFMRMWARGSLGGHYKLRKNEIALKLTQILLNPYIKEPTLFKTPFKNHQLWNEFVTYNKTMVIEEYKPEMLSKIWKAIDWVVYKYTGKKLKENVPWTKSQGNFSKLNERFKTEFECLILKEVGREAEITMKHLYLVLWKAGKVPLVLIADNLVDTKNILGALALSNYSQSKRKVVLVLNERVQDLVTGIKKSLADVTDLDLRSRILDKMKVSLQGRDAIELSQIVTNNDEKIMKAIDIGMILEMLYQPLVIGKKSEGVPINYITRSASNVFLHPHVLKMTNHGFIIFGAFDEVTKQIYESFIDGRKYFERVDHSNIVVVEEGKKLLGEEMKHFARTKSAIHYLKFTKKKLEWLNSDGYISDLRPYLIPSVVSIPEDELLTRFSSRINIISSAPGMGKTVMIKRLAEKCMNDHWVVTVFLNNHHKYFKESKSPDLHYFASDEVNETFAGALIELLGSKKKVVYLLDAFDEIATTCANNVVDLTKSILKRGYRLWITTRPVQCEYLEKQLNIFAISLDPITIQYQKNYLKRHLLFSKNKHKNLAVLIDRVVNLISKSTNLESSFLGVPLHLQMVAEVVENNTANEFETINVTHLYDNFIDKKLNNYWVKMFGDVDNPLSRRIYQKEIELLKMQHSKAALFLFYSKEALEKSFDCVEIEEFLKNTKTGDENVGIIMSITDVNQPIFTHRTFAEFLAAKYLAFNFGDEKVKSLLIRLFDQELAAVRHLFDRILAENKPAHLAVLSNDLIKLKSCNSYNEIDLGGRTLLHIAASLGTRHVFPKSPKRTHFRRECLTIALSERDHKVIPTESNILEILKLIISMSRKETSSIVDYIFGWYPVDYAIHTYSLDVLDAMFEPNISLDFFDVNSLIYYCVRFGYVKMLNVLHIERYIYLIETATNLLQVAINSTNNTREVLEILIKKCSKQVINNCLNRTNQQGISPLMNACITGNLEVLQKLLNLKNDKTLFNKQNIFGLSPLHCLVFYNNFDCLKVLIEENIDLNLRADAHHIKNRTFKNPGHTALYFGIINKNIEITSLLIEKGAKIHLTYEHNRTALHAASIIGFTPCIVELLKKGADINSIDNQGRTPLHYAAQNSKLNSGECLLALNADINYQDQSKRTPLHYLAQNVRLDQIIFPPQIKINVNIKDNGGKTPLFYACQKIKITGIKYLSQLKCAENWHHYNTSLSNRLEQHEKLPNIKFLQIHGANLNETDDRGLTPLHYAAEDGNEEICRSLLDLNADINKKDKNGETILFKAVKTGNLKITKFLLNFTPELDCYNKFNVTPLHVAAEKEYIKCAELLLKHGANLNLSSNKTTPLFIAVQKNNKNLVELFINHNSNVNAMSPEVFNDNQKGVHENSNYMAPMHAAARDANANIIRILLQGKKIKINQTDNNGWTPLHFATVRGDEECLRVLLENGAALHFRNKAGLTPVHQATLMNRDYLLEVLLSFKGGNAIDLLDNEGQTALHIACRFGYLRCVKTLIWNEADVNLCDKGGFTPLGLAIREGHTEVVDFVKPFTMLALKK